MDERRIAVITGSTGGIGGAIADQLAASGWHLVLVNRNDTKAQAQKVDLQANHPSIEVDTVTADLMDVEQIEAATQTIAGMHPKVDVLFNNSGVLTSERVKSVQGHESNYAVNTLAAYVMTQGLRPALQSHDDGSTSMIVNTTSSAHNAAKSLDTATLSDPKDIGGLTGAYATTKLALTTMGTAMASELEADGIIIRSVCPGAVVTPMTKTSNAMPGILKLLVPLLFKSPDKQAAKMIRAAQTDSYGGQTGIYITNGKEKPLPRLAQDASAQAKLMAKLSGDAGF